MFDRRSFIGIALSSLGLEVVRRMEAGAPDPMPVKLDPPPFDAKIEFGDLGLVVGERGEESLSVNTPWIKEHNGYVLDQFTTVKVARVACPKVVFESIIKTYGDVTKATTNPPVKISIQGKCFATLENVIITQVGTSVQSDDFVIVEDLHFLGVWTKLREAVKKFNEAQYREKEHNRVLIAFNDAIASDRVIPFKVVPPKS